MIRTFGLLVVLAALSGSAFAGQCPVNMKAIDDALPKAKLTAAQLEEVKKLRAEGEKLHQAGNHPASMEALTRAKKILGI
jgi:hypothetical protein